MAEKVLGGTTKNIDLGKGKATYKTTIEIQDEEKEREIFKLLRNQRYCTISDRFFGFLKTHIDRFLLSLPFIPKNSPTTLKPFIVNFIKGSRKSIIPLYTVLILLKIQSHAAPI